MNLSTVVSKLYFMESNFQSRNLFPTVMQSQHWTVYDIYEQFSVFKAILKYSNLLIISNNTTPTKKLLRKHKTSLHKKKTFHHPAVSRSALKYYLVGGQVLKKSCKQHVSYHAKVQTKPLLYRTTWITHLINDITFN
jgi:tellurite resistance-related uncharacterized protein